MTEDGRTLRRVLFAAHLDEDVWQQYGALPHSFSTAPPCVTFDALNESAPAVPADDNRRS